jgi:NAD(P)-dependent dehydrogenase (short-subunit alcohol dehydrogenase family)
VPRGLPGTNRIDLDIGAVAGRRRARPGSRRILVLLAASSSKRMDSAVGLDRIRAAPTQRLGSDLLRPVTFTARNYDRGAATLSRLRRENPRAQLSLELCDLSSAESIKSFARKLVAAERPVHALVHNAGVLRAPAERQLTASGIEITRATNALGPARLTTAMLPALAAAPVSRVLILTSRLHQPGAPREPG